MLSTKQTADDVLLWWQCFPRERVYVYLEDTVRVGRKALIRVMKSNIVAMETKWRHVDGNLGWTYLDSSMQKETANRGILIGNTKANLKTKSNLFWLEQGAGGWRSAGEVDWKLVIAQWWGPCIYRRQWGAIENFHEKEVTHSVKNLACLSIEHYKLLILKL